MKIPQHLTNHGMEYLVVGVLGLAIIGGLAYMDLRHITRADWVRSEIRAEDADINRLKLYNQFGTEGNKPAREQVILQIQAHKAELERELEELQ